MNSIFIVIVVFLLLLALFDLTVGVSNDAVNFMNSAVGSKAAGRRAIIVVAAVGIFLGACLSNGMMDVARNGVFSPEHFSFYEVMCIFLAVMVTDVVLLDVFNSLGLPTSTTVSLVFELLGGAFGLSFLKVARGEHSADGSLLQLGDLINSDKALTMILGIFLSVVVAFVVGLLVQWVARLVFTFTYRVNGKTTAADGQMGNRWTSSLKIGVFAGVAMMSISWFLLINGLKNSTIMTPGLKTTINSNGLLIWGCGIVGFGILMTMLSYLKLPVLKGVVMFGTFALAMAFAGNDLVNFVGVPLTGLDAYMDFAANGGGEEHSFMMNSLSQPAQTPMLFLMLAGVVMVVALTFSKKAQNVVKTEVGLSRQDVGEELFSSSMPARAIMRTANTIGENVRRNTPSRLMRWIDSRFNTEGVHLEEGAAYDLIRASINLVVAGSLVALGTSQKLPLSTTYVSFMVAMGTSLADRAWGRENGVFRITGIISVIGGWLVTAGAAFIAAYLMCNLMYFGGYVAMGVAIVVALLLLVRSQRRYAAKKKEERGDKLFERLVSSNNEEECWNLLCEHMRQNGESNLRYVAESYGLITKAFFDDDYHALKRCREALEEKRSAFKRNRRKEILGLRRINPTKAIEQNTWFHMASNNLEQMLYILKRILDPSLEHVGNGFSPVPARYRTQFEKVQKVVVNLIGRIVELQREGQYEEVKPIREELQQISQQLADLRKELLDDMQNQDANIESLSQCLNLIQESQTLASSLRHYARAMHKFEDR